MPRKEIEREQALSALSLMRREKLSLKEAAKKLDISPRIVLQHARGGLRRTITGNYYAKPVDEISRSMKFLTEQGIVSVEVTNSKDATIISKYLTATKSYLSTGKESFLAPFKGKRLGPHRFVTNPDILDELAEAGELEFDTIYNFIFGARM